VKARHKAKISFSPTSDITLHKARRRAGANPGPFGGSTRTITDRSGSTVESLPDDALFSKALDGATSRKHRRVHLND
jgi:hypothetical protein